MRFFIFKNNKLIPLISKSLKGFAILAKINSFVVRVLSETKIVHFESQKQEISNFLFLQQQQPKLNEFFFEHIILSI